LAGSGLGSGTKMAALGSSRTASGSAATLRARGLPRFTGLELASGAEVSSSDLGGRDIRVFWEMCACLGWVQGVHDAVDLGLEESG